MAVPDAERSALKNKLLTLMFLRVIFVGVFLGITAWFQLRESSLTAPPLYSLYAIIVTICLLTIVYSFLFKRIRNLKVFAHIQVLLDILLVTAIAYITGGADSFLAPLYFLAIISGSIILGRHGGLYAASISSIAYGLLVDLDYYHILPGGLKIYSSAVPYIGKDILTTMITNIVAFFVIAYLTGYLSERTARIERKLEEREIDFKRLESLNRFIIENINSGILTINRDGRITSFNKTAEKLTGHTLRDVYYKDIESIFPGIRDEIKGLPDGSISIRTETEFMRDGGSNLSLGLSISAAEGVDVDKIIIFQDLTKIKEMEEQLKRDERLKALGELAAGMAHEIRNPLASMSGSIEVLKESLKDDDTENIRLMDIILRETERMNGYITDFLLFARPASKARGIIDIKALIEDILEVFRNSPEAKGLEIRTGLADGILVDGDARQMKQVFWNLFLNAQQAMPQGGKIEISAQISGFRHYAADPNTGSRASGSPPFVEVTVGDNGTGIESDNLGRIFDPFFSSRESGTGLGLAVVHRIIESHGGRIDVESKKGRGTTFRILLPIVEAGELAS